VALGEARERDDAGTWFESRGAELFAQWSLDRYWSFYGGYNWLEPDDSEVTTQYRILDFLLGAAYRLNPYVVVSGEGQLAESRDSEGEPLRANTREHLRPRHQRRMVTGGI
jgi:hypothetical protein